MLSKIITIGDKVHIEDDEKRYVSKVLDFSNEDQIKIAMPIYQNAILPIEKGFRSSFMFYTKRGIYIGRFEVMERFKEDNLCYLLIQSISELERFQRRQFYRLECLIDVLYYEEQTETNEPIEWKKAIVTDLSGGGMRFNCRTSYEPNQMLFLQLELPVHGYPIKRIFSIKVISCKPVIYRANMFEIQAEFYDISEKDRELVIKYVFEQERKIRHREKG